jgi:hypothetical protein
VINTFERKKLLFTILKIALTKIGKYIFSYISLQFVNSDRKILTTLRHSKREMIIELTRNIHMAISRDKKKQNQYFWTAYSVFTMPKE